MSEKGEEEGVASHSSDFIHSHLMQHLLCTRTNFPDFGKDPGTAFDMES
jgi:hypothetical protein